MPIVVTGFEPLDILEGIRRTVHAAGVRPARAGERLSAGGADEGNPAAKAMLARRLRGHRPGLARHRHDPGSGWRLSQAYREYDAEYRFSVADIHTEESAVCRSGEVLQGLIKPHECAAFGTLCTPRNPLGRHDGLVARARAPRTTCTGGSR